MDPEIPISLSESLTSAKVFKSIPNAAPFQVAMAFIMVPAPDEQACPSIVIKPKMRCSLIFFATFFQSM